MRLGVLKEPEGEDRVAIVPKSLRKWGKAGSANGELDRPAGLALAGQGPVYVPDSRNHRAGHIPASRFAVRANMPGNLSPLSDKAVIVLTSPDGVLARLAAADAGASGAQVKVLSGGTAGWVKAGHPMAKGFKDALDEPKDVWVRPYDLDQGNEAAMQTYLGWEVDLKKQIERDGTTNFLDFGAAGERGSR